MMLQVKNIAKAYSKLGKKKIVLSWINLEVDSKSKIAIIGKNGSGKTTLLNIISGLIKPDEGLIRYNNVNLDYRNASMLSNYRFDHIGIIPQKNFLISDYTVFKNISYPLLLRREKKELVVEAVQLISNRLCMNDFLNDKTYKLSVGQCQKVAVARAIIKSPNLLLADEPTSALDYESKLLVVDELMQQKGALIIITHDADIIERCSAVYLLENGCLTQK